MFICICNAVTERDVLTAVSRGARSLSDLQDQLGLACCCGACANLAQEYLPGEACAASRAGSSRIALMAQAAVSMPRDVPFEARAASRRSS